jgi:hypothetical protein
MADVSLAENRNFDYDTSGSTDLVEVVGLVVPSASGAVSITGDATNGLDVDVTRVIPGTTATALGKAEDTGHTTGDTGVMMLAVRNDAGTVIADTTLDYIPLTTDATGALRVTGTQYVEDVASAGGETVTLAGAIRQDTLSSTTSTDGDFANLKVNNLGRLYVASGAEYAEDSPSANADILMAVAAIRSDNPGAIVNADGDYIALRTDSIGRLWVNTQAIGSWGPGNSSLSTLVAGAAFFTTQINPTNAQSMAINVDEAGSLRVFPGMSTKTLSTQGTTLNATQTIFSWTGAQAVLVTLLQTTTITAGAITFEISYDGTNWVSMPTDSVLDPTTSPHAPISLPYTLQASTNKSFLLLPHGAAAMRIRTSTIITGTGTVTPVYSLLYDSPVDELVSVVPGTTATSLGKAEDAGHTTGDTGVFVLAVRNDAGVALTSTDLDYTAIAVDSTGAVHMAPATAVATGQVNVTNSAATLISARTNRKSITIVNRQNTAIFIGPATVSTANGLQIDAGAALTIQSSALIQGITAAASAAAEKVHYIEEYYA